MNPPAPRRSPLPSGQISLPEHFTPLPAAFYEPSAELVAPLLLGHWLLRRTPTGFSGGLIVETEAYLAHDPACHGFKRETTRNRSMYGPPGRAYVYFIYGNHWCFNTVCRPAGIAEAVLVRAIEPTFGRDWMQQQRPTANPLQLTNGPAKLCAALAIDRKCDGLDLSDSDSNVLIATNPQHKRWMEAHGPVVTTQRIGLTKAADWPLRFYVEGSVAVSRRVRR